MDVPWDEARWYPLQLALWLVARWTRPGLQNAVCKSTCACRKASTVQSTTRYRVSWSADILNR
jgi:hypothetical protein